MRAAYSSQNIHNNNAVGLHTYSTHPAFFKLLSITKQRDTPPIFRIMSNLNLALSYFRHRSARRHHIPRVFDDSLADSVEQTIRGFATNQKYVLRVLTCLHILY